MISWTQQPRRDMGRPKTGETPGRHVRIEDSLWAQIGEVAAEQGRTVTAVVIDALRRYVAWHKRQKRDGE
jgi:hypothetical protein